MMHIQYEARMIPKNADLIKLVSRLFSIQLNTGEDVKTSLWSSQRLFTAPFTPQAFIVGVGFVLDFPGSFNSAVWDVVFNSARRHRVITERSLYGKPWYDH